MKKTDLSGLTQKTFEITQNVKSLYFKNVSPATMIKVVVDKENQDIETPIRTMNLGKLLEGQDKINSIANDKTIVRHLRNVAADAANRIDVLENDELVLCLTGEYHLGENDKITVYLTNLGKVNADSSVTENVGSKVGTKLINYGKVVFQKAHDEKKLELLGVSALLIDPTQIPESIELYYEDETRILDAEVLKQSNNNQFGLIRMATNEAGVSSPIFGHSECLFINMGGVRKCVLKDEGSADNITVYTVKL